MVACRPTNLNTLSAQTPFAGVDHSPLEDRIHPRFRFPLGSVTLRTASGNTIRTGRRMPASSGCAPQHVRSGRARSR